ncbi:leucyl aminopeptidase [Altererythrobacter arenosus]|uniref:Probable cytosol aminopeptidase n=1 Tax=Altererythrobacter arenosus TaxID=3032592 RepID=A0ABY8FXS4_9SPHN|nr:leucyl aminopeptidase [Altererythrobacter sp. CAU 1644]WFL78066.1 leucyl aminopeptidase [Altererythrobacter sp. CAU 1644]
MAAQDVPGSGIAPGTRENSSARSLGFSEEMAQAGVVVAVVSGTDLPTDLTLDSSARERVAKAVSDAKFEGKLGQSVNVYAVGDIEHLLIVGAARDEGQAPDWRSAAGSAIQALSSSKAAIALVGAPDVAAMADMAFGVTLGQYRFDRYKSDAKPTEAGPVTIVGGQAAAASALWQSRHQPLAEGVAFARDLVNEPANVVYPESFIARAREKLAGVDRISIEVLDQADMRRLGMGAIAGVGQGSPRGARLMMITYRGAGGPPLALAGKGITFDSGGISIKPNTNMWEMKGDMSGAAAVTGAMLSLAKSKAPVHVVAAVALAENMPGGNAQRPGDVVRTLSGKTIEIRSTDAEGRLVLSDAIEYAVQQKKPFALVDIATLTGSVGVALGPEFAGVFARKDEYANRAIAAGRATGEHLWALPLHPNYRDAVKSDIADVKNSDASPAPGASAGAHFIEYFVPEDLPWVHIDMASVDRAATNLPLVPAGSRGFGVMLLDELVRNWRPQ